MSDATTPNDENEDEVAYPPIWIPVVLITEAELRARYETTQERSAEPFPGPPDRL